MYRLIERSIGTFVDDKKAQQLKDKGLPVEGMTAVAGRTDKGVTALNQVCSFCTSYLEYLKFHLLFQLFMVG